MTEIVLHDMSEYPVVLRRITQWGERRSPRGIETIDAGFVSVTLLNTAAGGMPLGIGRNLNPAIGAVEAAQLVAAVSDPELVLSLAPQFARYTDITTYDPTERMFWGAYGERIKLQALAQIKKITNDRDTRQAVITLWDPWLDNIADRHDYPCTIALQFSIRDGILDMNTIMRSNDAWLGLPYDVFQFTQLQASMANALDIETGLYRHTALSLHLYERDLEAVDALLRDFSPHANRQRYAEVWQPQGFGRVGDSFATIMGRATDIINGKLPVDPTQSEEWYHAKLHPQAATPNVG